MNSFVYFALSIAPLLQAQFVPPPSPVLLTTTKSGVLPVLPTPFNGTLTLEGAIINKAPVNLAYLPVNGPAQVQSNLPAATYMATLPTVAFDELTGTIISGSVVASSKQGDTGVTFTFNMANFPSVADYGPFKYHIHDMPVPASGNCTETMGHFDYTNYGEYYTCPLVAPQNCQVGDLSGKHGTINGTTFSISYVENYLSTDPSSPYFFGAKSIVIHTKNTTRLTCANFMKVNSASPTATAGPVATFTGAASKNVLGGAIMGAAMFLGLAL